LFGCHIVTGAHHGFCRLLKHPHYLKNQIWLEIRLAVVNFPSLVLLTALSFVTEIRYATMLYDTVEFTFEGVTYALFSLVLLVLFTDFTIYWLHRAMHHPVIYPRLHKVSTDCAVSELLQVHGPTHASSSTATPSLCHHDSFCLLCIPLFGLLHSKHTVLPLPLPDTVQQVAILGYVCSSQLLDY